MNPPPLAETGGPGKRRSNTNPWTIGAIFAVCGCFLFVALGGVMLFPAFKLARKTMQQSGCIDHLRSQASALITYAEDHDDRLPPGDQWMDAITPIVAPDQGVRLLKRRENAVFRCPAVQRPSFGYAFNRELSSARKSEIKNPENVPLTFDSVQLDRNVEAKLSDVPPQGRHDGKNNFAFLDGHVKAMTPDATPKGLTDRKQSK